MKRESSNPVFHNKVSYYLVLFLSSSCLFIVEISSLPVSPLETLQSQNTPQGKQGILEIPKQAATVIRHWIDLGLQNIFNIATPPPTNNLPPELKGSIVGNFVLGNLLPTLAPAAPHTPEKPAELTEVKPIFSTNEESYAGHSQKIEPTTAAPPPPPPQKEEVVPPSPTSSPTPPEKIESSGDSSATSPPKPPKEDEPQVTTKKPRVTAIKTTQKVHILDTDTSLNGIYNSYGLLINNVPGDEVYWIPDATRPSIVIPIRSTTTPEPPEPSTTTESEVIVIVPETEPPTESAPVETTTEEEEEEGIGEEAEVLKKKKLGLS